MDGDAPCFAMRLHLIESMVSELHWCFIGQWMQMRSFAKDAFVNDYVAESSPCEPDQQLSVRYNGPDLTAKPSASKNRRLRAKRVRDKLWKLQSSLGLRGDDIEAGGRNAANDRCERIPDPGGGIQSVPCSFCACCWEALPVVHYCSSTPLCISCAGSSNNKEKKLEETEIDTDALVERLARTNCERQQIEVISDGLMVAISQAEELFQKVPRDQAENLRGSLFSLQASWKVFLSQPLEGRSLEQSKILMSMVMNLMQKLRLR